MTNWLDLDEDWRRTFEDARDWLPLTVTPVGAVPSEGATRGFVAVLSGARDVVVCLEHRAPRAVSTEDRQLVLALFGHISLAMQHVRQLEVARETSLTLQRSLLPASTLPAGCAVRYEPAVPRWRSAATSTTSSPSVTTASASSSATAWAGVCPPLR